MWPEVFRIEVFGAVIPLKSFGLFVACGFLAGFWMGTRLSRKYGSDPAKDHLAAGDVCWWVLIGAIGGARLAYVLVNLGYFLEHPLEIVMVWKGGLVMYGGLILAIILGFWKIRQHRIHVWQTADYALTAGFLGQAIGRLGCLAVGDDFGRPTDVPWAIKVPDSAWLASHHSLFDPGLAGQWVHPTQLYLAFNALLLFLLGRALLSRRRFKGQVFVVLLAAYALTRFLLEFYRGDAVARGGIWKLDPAEAAARGVQPELLLSTSQLVGLALLPALVLFYAWLRRRPDAALGPGGVSAPPAD